jgi:predicted anti-sigma-YlaC factor YlaD
MDQNVCAALTRFFERTENELSSAEAALVVEHVRSCSQCRNGLIVMPPPGESSMGCEHCQGNLGAYYDATHPERGLGEMDGRAVLMIAGHLAQCEACRDVFNALLQLSAQEEQGGSGI